MNGWQTEAEVKCTAFDILAFVDFDCVAFDNENVNKNQKKQNLV